MTLKYPDGTLAHIHVSRFNPRASNTFTVVGERRTVHWDATDPAHTLRLYDTTPGAASTAEASDEFEQVPSENVLHLPDTAQTNPYTRQTGAFLESVLAGTGCDPGAREYLNATKVLEAATRSMKTGGGMCPVETTPPILCKAAWATVETVGTLRRRQGAVAESDVQDAVPSEDPIVEPRYVTPKVNLNAVQMTQPATRSRGQTQDEHSSKAVGRPSGVRHDREEGLPGRGDYFSG